MPCKPVLSAPYIQLPAFISCVMHSPLFSVFIDGSVAIATYNSGLSSSFISSEYCLRKGYHSGRRRTTDSSFPCAVSVHTSSGQFLCLLTLAVEDNLPCDVVLGRDWFNFCSTGIPQATIALSDSAVLDFSLSPIACLRSQSGERFYVFSFLLYLKLHPEQSRFNSRL